jgi:uncharacterized repeat protein (TIGR03943 family)
MRPLLYVAGAVLTALSAAALWRSRKSPGEHVPRSGWLMLAPVFALLLVAPASLGSYAADRDVSLESLRRSALGELSPEVDGASPTSFTDVYERLRYAPESLRGKPVRLVGIAGPATSAQTFTLIRFYISCCAADAFPLKVRVRGAVPRKDSWVAVDGEVSTPSAAVGDQAAVRPEMTATRIQPVRAPAHPYEG